MPIESEDIQSQLDAYFAPIPGLPQEPDIPLSWLHEPPDWVQEGRSVLARWEGPNMGRVAGFGGSWGTRYMVDPSHPAYGFTLERSKRGYESFLCGNALVTDSEGRKVSVDTGTLSISPLHANDPKIGARSHAEAMAWLNRQGKWAGLSSEIVAKVNLIETDYGPLLLGFLMPYASRFDVDLINGHTLSPELWPKGEYTSIEDADMDLVGFAKVERTALPMEKTPVSAQPVLVAADESAARRVSKIVAVIDPAPVAAEEHASVQPSGPSVQELITKIDGLEEKLDALQVDHEKLAVTVQAKLMPELEPEQATIPDLQREISELRKLFEQSVRESHRGLGEAGAAPDTGAAQDRPSGGVPSDEVTVPLLEQTGTNPVETLTLGGTTRI